MSPKSLPLIALTQGDPAGIGPEICLKAAWDDEVLAFCRPLIVGDLHVLKQVARRLNLRLPDTVVSQDEVFGVGAGDVASGGSDLLNAQRYPALLDCQCIHEDVAPGVATEANGHASYRYITTAIRGALEGRFDATTTAPITKTTLHLAGIEEPGHTEIYAKLTGTQNFAMLFYSPRLAVSFVTCHQSLRSVPDALTVEGIRRVVTLTGEALRRIRGREPRLVVLGLNPHAGEGRLFGDEDADIVAPAVELARRDGWNVAGPIPPDAAFMPHALEKYDGHVTLYHDQGAIPFKMVSLHDGVNVTMGLPIVRTSVDHGTAYDIAWQGQASPSSLIAALRLAGSLAAKSEE